MGLHDRLALRLAVFGIGQSEHVHLDARRHQRDDRVHVLRDARRGVQRDRGPDRVDVGLRNAVAAQEVARGIGTVDLEPLMRAAVLMGQAHVVEHGAGIEQLGVELEPAVLAGESAPK